MIRSGNNHRQAFLLTLMNRAYEGVSISFYIPLWNSMIYNSFIEWAKAGMSEPVEKAVERVRDRLRLVADSIETGLTNSTQNKRL